VTDAPSPNGRPGRRRVVLLTGASSGIGLASAQRLAAAGYQVYGTSRSGAPVDPRVRMLAMDVTSDTAVARAVEQVVEVESRIDVLVNNAGIGIAGAVEETSIDEARAQFETNVFGPLRTCRAVLPHMRRQGAGLIVNMSSIAGLVPVPFQAFYSASKAALESITEALRMEVKPFGIEVALLEPGDFRTAFTANRVRTAAAVDPASPYRERFDRALAVMERDERGGEPPDVVARELERIVATPSPALRRSVGKALQRAAPALRQMLPAALYERMLMQTYDIHRP
jgi:NAD(P)-dependent dehydrogenase (short-subunit alcohol dehydrogenase family)